MAAQSHLSEKNVNYLKPLVTSSNAAVAEGAAVLLEVARLAPYRRRRFQLLRRHRELWDRMARLGMVAKYSMDSGCVEDEEWVDEETLNLFYDSNGDPIIIDEDDLRPFDE